MSYRPSKIPPDGRDYIWKEINISDHLHDGYVTADLMGLIGNLITKDIPNAKTSYKITVHNSFITYGYGSYGQRDEIVVWYVRETTDVEKHQWDKIIATKKKKALADKLRRTKRKEKLELKEREQLRLLKAKYEK